jgi:hypothetical protein
MISVVLEFELGFVVASTLMLGTLLAPLVIRYALELGTRLPVDTVDSSSRKQQCFVRANAETSHAGRHPILAGLVCVVWPREGVVSQADGV